VEADLLQADSLRHIQSRHTERNLIEPLPTQAYKQTQQIINISSLLHISDTK